MKVVEQAVGQMEDDILDNWDCEKIVDPEIRAELEKRFGFVYPYEYRKDIPVKVSVSDLKKKSYHEDTDIEEAVYFEPDIVPLVPRFIEEKKEAEKYTTDALIRGVCRKLHDMGYAIGGFNAAVTSRVLSGSGLSSSAAFEVLLVCILDGLYNGSILDGVTRAKISQWVENNYFGKPSGLMDQSACSIGGLVGIDFKHADPKIGSYSFDFAARGFSLVVLATNSSHDDLTDGYAAIPREMRAVAEALGGKVLRDVKVEQLLERLPEVRQKTSDRAVLRALHYYDENERVRAMYTALENGDLDAFLDNVIRSGESSWKLLQNLYVGGSTEQSLALACALSERMLRGSGAWRVHGGGFAGTILAFVPHYKLAAYVEKMNAVFGAGACTVLDIRPVGAKKVEL